jgi:preprotein translocase subunit SecE
VARDRKRAKQRRARGARSSTPPTQPIRRDLPGALDHASSDVDEFDAAILKGAHGVPISSEALEQEIAEQSDLDSGSGSGSGGGSGQKPGSGDGGDGEDGPVAHPTVPPQHTGNRAFAFLRASWAELQRVQWPDRPQVIQATTVVLGFVVIAGAYLGAADWVAQKLVNLIL